jgi:hypothetical protein
MEMSAATAMKKKWLAVIHVAQAQLNLTDEAYRLLLKERYGVKSAKELLPDQGKDLIDYFKGLGFIATRKVERCTKCAPRPKREAIPTGTVYPVSQAQLAKIGRLKEDIRWKKEDGFSRWLLRYFNIRTIQTSTEASAIIWALLRIWRNQNKCRCVLVATGGKKRKTA